MDDGDTFRVPPVPLASGRLLPDPDGRTVVAVELVVTTADGGTVRIALHDRHGAWWAPPDG
ncbi:Hypothetical protein KLENKIAIHU_1237 [Klenkia terrae]|uniref:hypothetical protein n=1 Tax=Klenkia terrae TaxID=1052259 RepID=UPI00175404DD|nr:hypothetical protein [Klenkia terrae]SSC22648.1 Hypothetical protein KLENKIAIHU_1237 [Klenkia terrae]